MKLLRKLYDWTLEKSKHSKAPWFLAIISFAESSFFPIPPDIILIPMVVARQAKAWFFAFICTFSSVFGGIAGYMIGYFFYNSLGFLIVEYYSLESQFANFNSYYNQYGLWIVLGAGFTPFPFKIITIASGLFELNIFLFTAVTLLGRGMRFFLIAGLIKMFGNFITKFIDKYFNILAMLFFILLIGSLILVKFL